MESMEQLAENYLKNYLIGATSVLLILEAFQKVVTGSSSSGSGSSIQLTGISGLTK